MGSSVQCNGMPEHDRQLERYPADARGAEGRLLYNAKGICLLDLIHLDIIRSLKRAGNDLYRKDMSTYTRFI